MGFLWSLAAIFAGYFIGEIVRLALRRVLPKVYYPYANELISTFQLSVCVFEISVIGRFYNPWIALWCSFVLLTVKNFGFVFEGALANPCGLLEDLVYDQGWLTDNIAKIVFQVLGALLSFPFIQMLWLSTWSELHYQQVKKGLRSTLDVSLLYGFSIEILATFVSTTSDFLSRGTLRRFNPVIRSAVCEDANYWNVDESCAGYGPNVRLLFEKRGYYRASVRVLARTDHRNTRGYRNEHFISEAFSEYPKNKESLSKKDQAIFS